MRKDEEQEQQVKRTIRIVDRRRFDSEGDEKAASEENGTVVSAASSIAATPAPESPVSLAPEPPKTAAKQPELSKEQEQHMTEVKEKYSEENASEEPEISFGSFVLSLATQALVQLGQVKPPEGMDIPVDPIAAKQTIDILSMLEGKTKGNLDAQEERLLREALHNLRVAFLRFR